MTNEQLDLFLSLMEEANEAYGLNGLIHTYTNDGELTGEEGDLLATFITKTIYDAVLEDDDLSVPRITECIVRRLEVASVELSDVAAAIEYLNR